MLAMRCNKLFLMMEDAQVFTTAQGETLHFSYINNKNALVNDEKWQP